jgi:hypothetical protein
MFAEVTQEEVVQAHVSIGQKYGRTLLTKVEEPVEQLRNIINEYLDRKEQCFMTHPGGFRYINRNQIPPDCRPSAICHSYMAGLQYTLPMNAQVVQAVEQAGLGPQDVDVVLIHLDPGCYGPKGDCVIKFTSKEAWRMFERYYEEARPLTFPHMQYHAFQRTVNLKECMFILMLRQCDREISVKDDDGVGQLRTFENLKVTKSRVMTLPWHRGHIVNADGTGAIHDGLHDIWREEERNGNFIKEFDFCRSDQELLSVMNSRDRAGSKGKGKHGDNSRQRSNSRYERY